MTDAELGTTSVLLLIAGHETTVNLTANGILTLLRHPAMLERLRAEPQWAMAVVEELLRYEPPVQYLPNRFALEDIQVGSVTIPRGARLILLLAAASRDPERFDHPDRFDPDRADNEHLGFGSGIHYCFGAPLARLEAALSLTTLARRLVSPRLASDPPPYRPSPVLRGPRHLLVAVDGVRARPDLTGPRGPPPQAALKPEGQPYAARHSGNVSRKFVQEMLQAELDRTEPSARRVLHSRAAVWHEEHGSLDEALDYARMSGDLDMAARIVCGHVEDCSPGSARSRTYGSDWRAGPKRRSSSARHHLAGAGKELDEPPGVHRQSHAPGPLRAVGRRTEGSSDSVGLLAPRGGRTVAHR